MRLEANGLATSRVCGQFIMSDSSRRNPLQTALLVVGFATGAWYFFNHFEIHGLDQLAVQSKPAIEHRDSFASANLSSSNDWSARVAPELVVTPVSNVSRSRQVDSEPMLPPSPNLRIASWALGGFGPDKLDSVKTIERLASVIRGFDVIAIQQLRPTQRDFVPQLLAVASGNGRRYDYILGQVHQASGEQLAFFFDTNRVVTDRTQLYTVADPDQRMTHDPLVAWFQSIEQSPQLAWTFSFVNVRIELPLAQQEVAELPRILAAVARDGRGEDDCLMGGLFQADDVYLLSTMAQPALRASIQSTPTDIFAKHQSSNLIYNDVVTTEAMGRGGVIDFLRRENLSLSEAEQVSPYLPVYGEFSTREGGVR
jgi:deoxyribonuclease-1-like protein